MTKVVAQSTDQRRAASRNNQAIVYLGKLWKFCLAHKIQIAIFVVAFAVFFVRRTDALLNPQFFAEDGRWVQNAFDHHYSLVTLGFPYAGYLVIFPRLVALLGGVFSLEVLPLVFNVFALSAQSLVLVYLWSKRTDFIDTRFKIYITVLYLLLPFSDEVHGNITNSQWYLALLLFLFLFLAEARRPLLRLAERALVLVISLTGPFSILLSPIILFEAWRSKKMPTIHRIVLVGAFIQCITLALSLGQRKRGYIGPSITHLFDIIGSQVFGAGLFGTDAVNDFLRKPWIAPLVAILGLQLMIYIFIKSNKILRYFLAFAAIIFAASLVSPVEVPAGSSWLEVLNVRGVGGRYFFIPHVAIFLAIGWLCLTRQRVNILLRASAVVILALALLIGVPKDFIHTPYKDFHYSVYTQKYKRLEPGQKITIPTLPGSPWKITLTK